MIRGDGFEITNLPPGTRVEASETSWDVFDGAGNRIARIEEEPWSHAFSPAVGPSPNKVAGVDAVREEEAPAPEPWGADTPMVVRWAFETRSHIYSALHVPGAEWVVENWRWRDR